MKCDNCGTENPDEALFCKNCGARLDGNVTCPHCGKLLPADSKFCMYCGYRFGDAYAQTNAPAAGAYGAGYGYVPAQAYAPKRVSAPTVLKYVSDGLAMLAALFGVIFVFLTGFSVTVPGADMRYNENIYYFFGDVYNEINASGYEAEVLELLKTGAALSTVIVAVGLAAVVALFVFAAVRYVRSLLGADVKNVITPAALTFAAYICSVAGFFACVSTNGDLSSVEVNLAMSGATVAGVVLSSVMMFAAVVVSIVASGKPDLGAAKEYIASVPVLALLIVLLCMPAFGFVFFSVSDGVTGITIKSGIFSSFSMFAGFGATGSIMEGFNGFRIGEMFIAVMFVMFILVAAMFAVLTIGEYAKSFAGGSKSNAHAFAIPMAVFSLIAGCMQLAGTYMVTGFLDNNLNNDLTGQSANVNVRLAVPILIIVFSVLLIVAVAVSKAVTSSKAATAKILQNKS